MSVRNSTEPVQSPSYPRRRRGRLPVTRIVVLLGIVAAVTGLGLWGAVWWDDRPLSRTTAALERKDYQSALRSAERYLADHPDDLRAGILKARALSGLGRHREADALFERLARSANGFPDDAAALRDWSTSLLHLQRWHRAIAILENVLESHPSDPNLTYSLAAAQIRAKHYTAALATANRLRKIDGYADQADVLTGTIHHDLGNRRLALAAWEQILARNPEATNLQIPAGEFLTRVGDELLALGHPRRAATILEQAVAKQPTAGALASLGTCYEQTGRIKQAEAAWKRAVKLEPMNAEARGELANAALGRGQPQQAVDWLRPLTTTSGINSRSAYLLQRAYTQLKQPDAAAMWRDRAQTLRRSENVTSTLDELLRRSTDPYWISVLHAYQLAEQKDWDAAAAIVGELLKQRGNDAFVSDLAAAVSNRTALPALSRLTGKQY